MIAIVVLEDDRPLEDDGSLCTPEGGQRSTIFIFAPGRETGHS